MPYILHIDDSPKVSAKISKELPGPEIKWVKIFGEIINLKEKPLLIILDLKIPNFTDKELAPYIIGCFGRVPIIIFSEENETRIASAKKTIGAEGAISKHDPQRYVKLRRDVLRILKPSNE
jgi:DNA-binding NarL/FixJ family response regulator